MKSTFLAFLLALFLIGCNRGGNTSQNNLTNIEYTKNGVKVEDSKTEMVTEQTRFENLSKEFLNALEKKDLPVLMDMFADRLLIMGKPSIYIDRDLYVTEKENGFDGFLDGEGFLYWVLFDTKQMMNFVENIGELHPGYFDNGDKHYCFLEAYNKDRNIEISTKYLFIKYILKQDPEAEIESDVSRKYRIIFHRETGLIVQLRFYGD